MPDRPRRRTVIRRTRIPMTMRQATQWHKAGAWPASEAAGTVTLSYADRCKRRIQMTDDSGAGFLLSLQRAVRLSDGDGLQLEQGGFLRVVAGPEPLVEATAQDPQHLARLAWHIGNRHVPAEIVDGLRLRIVADSVLEAMLHQLGAAVRRIEAPFAPEGGAYAQLGINGHAH
ncbi:urease accessory protein UreE [Dongia sedimenti]|uniref:Urease accessory protein UreE n=1 Tax=Dongia sedimenti TaxID=3064282 RepID=A0ABU0YI37_9PROT|nr:urease accessory protein UreE [Rhodospirillaceae bacterium R-7]